ncbi:MAG TPA: AMP-binding protein, partial [Myxococcota bacterium]|nr:AMP-binding protein [Myxococcota bacterium]
AGELVGAAARVATQLRAAGLRQGDRALLVYLPGLDFVRSLVGCLVAGVLPVPVFPPPPFQKGPEAKMLLQVAADAQAAALLSTRLFVEASLADPGAELPALPWICSDEAPEPDGLPPVEVGPATVAFLQYTSGSTGNPKGVCITHGNLLDQLSMYREELLFGPDARLVFWVPPYHDLGLISGILAVLAGHGQAIMMSPLSFLRRPAAWAEAMVAFRATHIAAPNFAFDLLVRKTTAAQRAAWDLRSLRVVLSGGESIRPATVRRFLAAFADSGLSPQSWCSAYGLAEHTVGVTVGGRHLIWVDPVLLDQGRLQVLGETPDLLAAPPPGTAGLMSCGSPRAGVDLRIVDPQTGSALGDGQVGEIWAHSASKAAGYHGRPAESSATFQAPLEGRPWLRTGDLGAIHAGELYVCGRLKDLVIVGGRKIHPQDVEDSLRDVHPKLRPGCTVVFAGEPGEGGLVEGLVVVAELSGSLPVEQQAEVEAAIRDAVRRNHRLACAAVVLGAPGMVLKTTSGKLRRRACAEAWRSGALVGVVAAAAPPSEPPGGMLALLRGLLGQVLGRSPAGIPADRPLGELGASSLQLVEFTERLEQRLGRPVPSTLPFDAPPLGEMAALLSGQRPPPGAPLPAAPGETLCIVGIGCRFPGGVTDLSSFEELLFSGREVVEEVPPSRWDVDTWYDPTPGTPGKINSRWGAWIHGIESFDADFFDFSPAEAPTVDPQERLLLETAWEALEQVGLRREELLDSSTGVFVGISGNDYQSRLLRIPGAVDGHSLLG